MRLVEILISWAKRKYSRRCKIISTIIGIIIFLILIPEVIVYFSLKIDELFGLKFNVKPYSTIVGILLILLGLFISGWASYYLLKLGKGTPLPIAPTQRLVIAGPYNYCRNPIMLGSIIYYLGLILIVNSLSGILLVIMFEALYGIYIKFIEERELELRFGEEYLRYKEKTPFLIPRLRRK